MPQNYSHSLISLAGQIIQKNYVTYVYTIKILICIVKWNLAVWTISCHCYCLMIFHMCEINCLMGNFGQNRTWELDVIPYTGFAEEVTCGQSHKVRKDKWGAINHHEQPHVGFLISGGLLSCFLRSVHDPRVLWGLNTWFLEWDFWRTILSPALELSFQ